MASSDRKTAGVMNPFFDEVLSAGTIDNVSSGLRFLEMVIVSDDDFAPAGNAKRGMELMISTMAAALDFESFIHNSEK